MTGPADVSNRRILTQSFVHRTHIEIFGVYFAEPFKNWWSDDWLTKVYGKLINYSHHITLLDTHNITQSMNLCVSIGTANTLRDHTVTVRHQVSSEGQRYPVIPLSHSLCVLC